MPNSSEAQPARSETLGQRFDGQLFGGHTTFGCSRCQLRS
jgi:hypothetical protein